MAVDAGMIVVLVFSALAIGAVVSAEIHSRRQKRRGQSGEALEGEAAKPST